MEAYAQLLAEATKEIFGSLSRESDVQTMKEEEQGASQSRVSATDTPQKHPKKVTVHHLKLTYLRFALPQIYSITFHFRMHDPAEIKMSIPCYI